MTANANIIVAENVLTVPSGAVVRGSDATGTVNCATHVRDDGKGQRASRNQRWRGRTQIIEGINEGAHCVLWKKNEEDSTWRTQQSGGMGGPPPPMKL